MKYIDDFLNRITMYRLVMYYLAVLLGVAFILSFFSLLPFDPTELAFSTVVLVLVTAGANWAFAHVFEAQTNVESSYITALILALIISPVHATDHAGVGFLIFAGVWASASKYLFAIGKKHLFNPAAFAVALSAFAIGQPATWWVGGNLVLLPVILIGGFLIIRKIQRFDMTGSFAVVALITTAVTTSSGAYGTALSQTLLHSSFFFLASVMLTEPLTAPQGKVARIIYGGVVGFLFAPNIHIGSFYLTPEIALLIGNVFAYAVSPKGRYMLKLARAEEAAKDVYDFVFVPDRPFSFAPGQYLEWTLEHANADDRGNRRYFTIASSPTEGEVRLGVKFYPQASTFKQKLAAMKPGAEISVSHLAGTFTLPARKDKKLVFIAGGIGITPFRSMIEYLLAKGERRDISVFYSNKFAADVAYKPLLQRAETQLGIKTTYALSGEKNPVPGAYGALTPAIIREAVPDFRDRTFYISGPHGMVESFKKTLREMGVSPFKIKVDFFPGFA